MADAGGKKVGRVRGGDRSGSRYRVRGRLSSADLQRPADRVGRRGRGTDRRDRRGGAAPWRGASPGRGDEADRRDAARDEGRRYRGAHLHAGRTADPRQGAERAGRAGGLSGQAGGGRGTLADSPRGAESGGSVDRAQDVRDRDQGHRPARAIPAGRQGRVVRGGRRRQGPSSSRSLSTTSPSSTGGYRCSGAWASGTREGNDLWLEFQEERRCNPARSGKVRVPR